MKKKFQLLIDEKTADLNKKTIDNSTGLHIAVQKGNKPYTDLLLKAKADTNLIDKWGKTPLHYAVEDSKKDIVKLLLPNSKGEGGCDLDAVDENGYTALLYAAENNAQEVVKLLIDSKKCNLDFRDELGRTALHKAAYFGHTSVVKLLVDSRCKIEKDLRLITPLDMAKEWNNEDIVKLLQREFNIVALKQSTLKLNAKLAIRLTNKTKE